MELTAMQRRSLLCRAFCQRSVWLRAAWLGASAGMLQAAINQGDVWLHRQETLETVIKTIASPAISTALVLVSAAATWMQKTAEKEHL